MFEFRPQPMSYELMNDEVFTEVLCPQTIHDLVDYHLREYKKRFGWIRKGKITKMESYKWSAAAQKKRKECEVREITAEEFGKWLAES